MSYQVLARKWRPQNFADVVGQEHVLTALANGLSLGRIHHAYLFSGTRGVGKTSIARLLAKGLNCETGITATPCGVCDNCREIEQGRFVDLIEIDAASRTKVEATPRACWNNVFSTLRRVVVFHNKSLSHLTTCAICCRDHMLCNALVIKPLKSRQRTLSFLAGEDRSAEIAR